MVTPRNVADLSGAVLPQTERMTPINQVGVGATPTSRLFKLASGSTPLQTSALTNEIQNLAGKIGYSQASGTNYGDIKIDVNSASDVNNISDNVLSEFIIYQYNFALSMLPMEVCTNVQAQLARNEGTIKSININSDLGIDGDRSDRSVTLASTGETKRNTANLNFTTPTTTRVADELGVVGMPSHYDIVDGYKTFSYQSSEWNYYSIDSVTVENVLAPSANNPAIADMLTLKMRLIEPHGFRFAEDIRQIADGLGYEYVPSTRYLWRIDIWFSGYDMRGNWYDNIPLKSTASSTPIEAISYYVNLATVDAKLDGRGTVYELGFVPSGHQAWRPEDVVFDSLTITSAGQNNFGEFLDTLSRVMEETRFQTSDSNIKRKYKFFAPDVVRSSPFNSEKFFNKKNMLGPGGGDAKSKAKDVDVIKLLEEAWADCKNLQDMFLADEDNDDFLKPRIMIGIEFNTVYGSSMSPGTKPATNQAINDFDTITHQYKLVPYVTFKRGTPTKDTLKAYLDPVNQLSRIRAMIGLGMINRVYDYLYTGDNTEVLNLDLNFQNFYYYVPIWPATSLRPNSVGIGNSATAGNLQTSVAPGVSNSALQLNGLDTISVDRVLNQIFGQVELTPTVDANSDYFQRIGIGGSGMNTLPYPSMLRMAISDGTQQRAAKYSYYQSDHLQYDMLKIDLEIRGDPIWLMSAYANGSISPLKPLPDKMPDEVVIVPKTDRCLFLRVHAPKQTDYMNPSRTAGSSDPMLIGGFYQVYKVTSTFTGGKFTQKLECGKYEHLNYIEQFTEKGYGQLFVIPFTGSSAGAVPPGTIPTAPPGTASTSNNPGQTGVPDTQTILIPASPGVLPVFAASNPNANSSNLGLRNNNPGNMRPGGRWDGTVGTYRGFDVYDSPERGVQNLWKNLCAYQRSGKNTVQKIISTWAPSSENNTGAYISNVCSACGVSPNQPLDFTDKTKMTALINAIITQEVGAGTMYNTSYIRTSLGWT